MKLREGGSAMLKQIPFALRQVAWGYGTDLRTIGLYIHPGTERKGREKHSRVTLGMRDTHALLGRTGEERPPRSVMLPPGRCSTAEEVTEYSAHSRLFATTTLPSPHYGEVTKTKGYPRG